MTRASSHKVHTFGGLQSNAGRIHLGQRNGGSPIGTFGSIVKFPQILASARIHSESHRLAVVFDLNHQHPVHPNGAACHPQTIADVGIVYGDPPQPA